MNEEMKTKWCPFVNFQIGPVNSPAWQGVAYTNRGQEYKPGACLCLGSDCAVFVPEQKYHTGTELVAEVPRCGLIRR